MGYWASAEAAVAYGVVVDMKKAKGYDDIDTEQDSELLKKTCRKVFGKEEVGLDALCLTYGDYTSDSEKYIFAIVAKSTVTVQQKGADCYDAGSMTLDCEAMIVPERK